jgi:hypothetical protein
MRRPSTFCCPTHAIIWEMLMKEPLEPAVTMRTMLLESRSDCWAMLPASSRALLSTWLTWFSNDSITVRPGCCSSSPPCTFSTSPLTSRLARPRMSLMMAMVRGSAMRSPMPMEKPCCSSQWLTVNWVCDRKARAASGPCSIQMTCTRPPADAPSVRLHSVPATTRPSWITTCASTGDMASGSPSRYHAARRSRVTRGRKSDTTCLPVHSGRGLSTAGAGTRPSQSSSHMSTLHRRSHSRKVSRLVKRRLPSRESCTMPITGRLAWGETILWGTAMISLISARGSCPCTRCMFISSPSKSAL